MEELEPHIAYEGQQTAEVHPFPKRRSGSTFEQAKQDLAAFKFALFETVAADPLLRGVPCLNLIVVYASLVTIDKKTLQPTTAYASNARIYSRAGLKSHNTARKARQHLEQYGYIVPVGSKNGIAVYRLENPNIERVQMHIQALDEYRREVRADQKQIWNERKSRMSKNDTPDSSRMSEVDTPENDEGVNICHPRVSEVDMQGCQEMTSITLKEYLSVIPENIRQEKNGEGGSDVVRGICEVGADDEGERGEAPTKPAPISPASNQQEKKNGYAVAKDGDPIFEASSFEADAAFSIPPSEAEAAETLEWLFEGEFQNLAPLIQHFAKTAIMAGNLRPSWVKARLANLNKPISTGDA